MRFDLTDDEWSVIEPLPPPTRQGGERRDDRQVLNGIFYVLRTGIPWDDLPARYGPHTTAYNRFNRWARQGIWRRLFDALASRHPASQMIDSTAIKAHRAAAGAEKGGSRAKPGRTPRRSAARAAGARPSSTRSSTGAAGSGGCA